MGKLKTFNELEEKSKSFTQSLVETKSDFDQLYKSFEKGTSIWRGASEASHRLYTSLQRFWIQEDLPNEPEMVNKYLTSIVEFANKWNLDFLRKYFKNYKIEDYTIYSVLSILRHHGTPTPILDWTRNQNIGLFFGGFYAQSGFGTNDISNFFSLYEMKKDHPYVAYDQKNEDFKFWQNEEGSLRELNQVSQEEDPEFMEKFYQGYLNKDELFFDAIRTSPILKIEDQPDDKFRYYINNNYNITNQEGLFILNVSPDLPLELSIEKRMIDIGEQREMTKELIEEAYEERHRQNFCCYDIHKSLRHYVLEKIKEDGIDKNYIYPDLEELSRLCVNDFMKHL